MAGCLSPFGCQALSLLEADYHVSGVLTPDATGNFFEAGTHDGEPYYRRDDNAWFLWWSDFDHEWVISNLLGVYGVDYWNRFDVEIAGDYNPSAHAVGIATVASGPE